MDKRTTINIKKTFTQYQLLKQSRVVIRCSKSTKNLVQLHYFTFKCMLTCSVFIDCCVMHTSFTCATIIIIKHTWLLRIDWLIRNFIFWSVSTDWVRPFWATLKTLRTITEDNELIIPIWCKWRDQERAEKWKGKDWKGFQDYVVFVLKIKFLKFYFIFIIRNEKINQLCSMRND